MSEDRDTRYVDCEQCSERYWGEDAIASYLTETPYGRVLCSRCYQDYAKRTRDRYRRCFRRDVIQETHDERPE